MWRSVYFLLCLYYLLYVSPTEIPRNNIMESHIHDLLQASTISTPKHDNIHADLISSAKMMISLSYSSDIIPNRLLCTTLTEATTIALDSLTHKLRTYMADGCD